MFQNRLLALPAIVWVVIAAGCSGGQPKAASTQSASSQSQTSSASATQSSSTDGNSSAPPGDTRNIDDLTGSLDSLKSYRMRFTYSYDGKNDKGEPDKGAIEFLQEYVAATKDQHSRMSGVGMKSSADASNTAFETFQVGGTTYMFNAGASSDQKCVSFSSGQDKSNPAEMVKPGDMLGGLHNATLVAKGESANGIVANHYQGNEKGLGIGLFTSAKADVWIAQDGGYVVKYVGQATGKGSLIGRSAEGNFKWEYNIEDANKIEAIQLPAECQSARPADDIPLPDTATEKGNFGPMTTFKSPDDVAKLTEFYQTALPAKGWKAAEGSMEGIMSYTKDNRTITIMITREDAGGSSVVINETKVK